MIRIRSVTPVERFQVRLGFTDGTEKLVDLEPFLRGPVFEPLKAEPQLFRAVRVDEELGIIVWPNGADIDPDVLYWGRIPASQEQAVSGSSVAESGKQYDAKKEQGQ